MSSFTKFNCSLCGKETIEANYIYNRRKKNSKSGKVYCSLECSLKDNTIRKRISKTNNCPGRPSVEDKFWGKVQKGQAEDDCWTWIGYKCHGYAYFSDFKTNKSPMRAHRFSYELHNGPIPEGLIIRHRCNNKQCTNPKHLILGTHQDNMDDKVKDNLQAKGVKCPRARFSEEQILEIRKMWAERKLRQKDIGNLFNVSQTCIESIVNYKTWKHVK